MGNFFERGTPEQAVPRDLQRGRQDILNALFGFQPTWGGATGRAGSGLAGGVRALHGGQTPANRSMGVLGDLLGLTSGTNPGGDVLGPLSGQYQQNLDYGLSAINASSPGRFSTANTYTQGQFTQRALNDYNVLAAQVLEHGRDRQLQAIMGLLGPVMGPMFGGPFTQDASGFENLLGLAGTVGQFIPGLGSLGIGGNRGGGSPGYQPGPWGAG